MRAWQCLGSISLPKSDRQNGRPIFYVALATAVACLVYFLFCLGNGESTSLTEFPLDDGWIHQVYVRGLITDGTFSYNAGEAEAGFTSPLWVLANVPFALAAQAADTAPVVPAKLLSLLFAIWAAVAIGALVARMGGGRYGRVMAIIIVLATPAIAFSAVSAMEVTLTAALLAQALLALYDKRHLQSGLWFGLAGLARPEVGAFLMVVLLVELVTTGSLRERLLRCGRLGLPALSLACIWFAYNLSVTGRPLPNTFYAKMTDTGFDVRLSYYVDNILVGPGLAWAVACGAFMALGVVAAFRHSTKTGRFLLLIVGAQAATVAAVSLLHPLQPGVQFYLQRYYYPFTVFDTVAVVFGLVWISRVMGDALKQPVVGGVVAALPTLLMLPGLADARSSYATHCSDIFALHTLPAHEAAHNLPPDTVIAVEGAGSARYNTDFYVLDLHGLNYYPLAHAQGDDILRSCLIIGNNPGYFLVPEHWLRAIEPAFELRVLASYHAPNTSPSEGADWVVVGARARPRPERLADCQARYGD